LKKKGWKGKKENDSKRGNDSSNITAEGEFAFTTMFAGAMLECNGSPLAELEVNVYDSSTSSHMSPIWKHLVSLMQIPHCQIKSPDQTLFTTTSMGELKISIPNDKGLKMSHYGKYCTAQTLPSPLSHCCNETWLGTPQC